MKKILIISILLFSIILYFSLFNIIIPSYKSFKAGCITKDTTGVVGYFNVETLNITICYGEGTEKYEKVLRHENCHYNQYFREGLFRLYNCSQPLGYIFTEIECYLSEYFPF